VGGQEAVKTQNAVQCNKNKGTNEAFGNFWMIFPALVVCFSIAVPVDWICRAKKSRETFVEPNGVNN